MTRASKLKKARHAAAPTTPEPRLPRGVLLLAVAVLTSVVVVGALVWNSSNDESAQVFTGVPASDPGPVHVHGLGINPADGSLFIATHTGLFRVGADSRKAVRIADRYQDTMGFTIVGPNRFLGSGHPDINEAFEKKLPPLLGLIESTDAGETWTPITLLGEADFHVLRSVGRYVYGDDASNDRLLRSADEGRTWATFEKPEPAELVDLAANPDDPRRLVASTTGGFKEGLFSSQDGGASWKRRNDASGLLAWPTADRLYLVNGLGKVVVSGDGGRTLERRGEIGGQPAALLAVAKDDVYVALHDGTIKRSTDGGSTWSVRSTP